MPLHCLCRNKSINETESIQILKLLIEKHPEAVRHATNALYLPIHMVSRTKSPEFCQALIEAYPDSIQVSDSRGVLPLHYACGENNVATVEFLYKLYPDAVNQNYPIHCAIVGFSKRADPEGAIETIQYLLDCDPDVKFQKSRGRSPLNFACVGNYNDSNIDDALEVMIKTILDAHPDAANDTSEDGWTPLHGACYNKSTTRGAIELLIDAAPASVCSVNNKGDMPLHLLCLNRSINETAAVEIAELIVKKHPEAVQRADNSSHPPIHMASETKSPAFCRALVEAYPGSEQITDANGVLPLHRACIANNVATVEFLYKLYPDAINRRTTSGYYPIHFAITGFAMEVVQHLLYVDPNVAIQKFRGHSLLHYACWCEYNDSNIAAAIQIIKATYDAHPEVIEDVRTAPGIRRYHEQVQSFINSESVFARQAEDLRLMMTPDDYGQLPLHTALQNNGRLGSIKLLVKGNPSAMRNFDDRGVIPLHIACQHHDSASVVGYMISLADSTLDVVDRQGNTALHYACRGAKYETIALLLDKFNAISVSKRNAQKKFPIDLLWESNEVLDIDRESVEYTESVFRLLRAYPEVKMISTMTPR